MQAIRAGVDDGELIHVILDNLNHHRGRIIRDWCEANRVELVFTPTHASWANPFEAHFGPLRQFAIASSDHRDHPALARAIRNYVRWRNAHTRAPNVLAAQRRQAARLRSGNNDDGATHEPPPHNARTFVVITASGARAGTGGRGRARSGYSDAEFGRLVRTSASGVWPQPLSPPAAPSRLSMIGLRSGSGVYP